MEEQVIEFNKFYRWMMISTSDYDDYDISAVGIYHFNEN